METFFGCILIAILILWPGLCNFLKLCLMAVVTVVLCFMSFEIALGQYEMTVIEYVKATPEQKVILLVPIQDGAKALDEICLKFQVEPAGSFILDKYKIPHLVIAPVTP